MIRARAKRPSSARWLPLTLAAAVATVLVIGGTAWLGNRGDDTPAAGPGKPGPSATRQGRTPEDTTRTVTMLVFKTAFQQAQFGLGAALAFILTLVILLFTLVQFRVLGRRVNYG